MSRTGFVPACLSLCASMMFAATACSENVITASLGNPVVPVPTFPYLPMKGTISLYVVPAAGGNALPVQWTVSDETILQKSVTNSNVFTALKEGLVTVTPTGAADMPDPLTLTVTPGIPVSFTVDAVNAGNVSTRSVSVKGTLTLTATGSYTTPSGAVNLPIPAALQWTKTGGTGSVSFAGNLLTATGAGTVVISGNDPVFPLAASPQTLNITVTSAMVSVPQFAEAPTAGNSYVKVTGNDTDTIVVHQLADADVRADGQACSPADIANGQVVPLVVSNAAADQATISGTGTINTLTLGRQLTPGMELCLEETAKSAGAVPQFSALRRVHDPNDFGMFRTYMTVGVQITNQQPTSGSGATQSSTAGEYLEVGLIHSFFRPSAYRKATGLHFHPGAAGVFDVRLSPVPVSAPATMAGTAAGSSTPASPPTISSLNLLSSQQSVRVQSQLAAPFWVGSWQSRYNVTTLSPLAKAGFMTLLNPTTAGTNTAGSLVTTNFSPTYSFFGFGGRLGWDRISSDPDEAPQMITKLDVTLAKYSNLPSYLCTSDKTKLGPATTTTTDANGKSTTTQNFNFSTACGQPNGTQAANAFLSKTLTYRLDIEALAKLPQYPFVLGVMANLAQYTVGHNANIDYLNKPGNDIRLFIGLTFPLSQLGDLLKGK